MNIKTRIKVYNRDQVRKALGIFNLLGGFSIDMGDTIDEFTRKYIPKDVTTYYIGLSFNDKVTAWSAGDNDNNIDINDTESLAVFIAEIVSYEKPTTIKGVGQYDAIISSENIQVGCQTISFEKFDEIAAAVKKHRKR